MSLTPFEYHDDESLHGSYQYLTLKEIIDKFMVDTLDDDDILKNTRRSIVLKHAKRGIRMFNKKVFNNPIAIEITVPESLYFALPHDFVSYARVSRVVEDPTTHSFRLQPLNVNGNINTANGYLQDHEWEIMFDSDGYILLSDASNVYNKPYKKYSFTESYCAGGNPNLDTSKLSKYGEFKIDEENGKIVFSSDLADQEIVLEYFSDGLSSDTYNEGEIKVHKDAVAALEEFIYYSCIRRKRHVSQGVIEAARRRWKTVEHEAKLDRLNLDLVQLSRTMRTKSRNI